MKSQRLVIKKSSRLNSPNSQSYVDLPTLTSRAKNSPLLPFLNSTYSIVIPEHTHLSNLRKRKTEETLITPQIVSNTLKKYFIPIFEAQRQRQKNLNTAKTCEFRQSLSEIFQTELKNSKKTLKTLNYELKQIQKDKEEKQKEMQALKSLILNHECTINAGKFKTLIVKKESFSLSLDKFSNSYYLAKKKNEREKKKLYLEKIKNSELEDKASTLEHFYSLYKKQSTITGERLQGLFLANFKLSILTLYKLYKMYTKEISTICVDMTRKEYSNSSFMYMVISNIHSTASDALNKLSERLSLQKELKMFMFKYSYEKDLFINETRKNSEEKEQFIKKFSELEKKSQNLEEEYEKMYKRVKDINKKHKVSDYEEKICKNCKKYFMDKDNFNWSCAVHPSEWGTSQFYYCCGATVVEAPGCKMSKHVSDELSKQQDHRPTLSKANLVCSFCGEHGHDNKNCLKDPNPLSIKGFQSKKKEKKVKKIQNYDQKLDDSDEGNFHDIEISKKTAASYTSPRHETWVRLDS